MYYNPEIPLETALEMFEDPHIRHEIIEDYFAAHESAKLLQKLGELPIEAVYCEGDDGTSN